ncbi:MarR family winged helix-turn-helix transcriptional regulator [Ruegeria sp. Ofav3-42]|uniref:MarR family winged helix-turn-helix transcriptional regulator n=1 Tax=Ruegeria sp. Ofav3-42 TaxID=2917759 RepID=UPI001EF5DB83|nr:MarR family winged helix-turn-helix transcriptional regulator [Ruegeria sp. Ofav3-42]MCG7522166.1 MarR family winged helix-turn-helix transcriptional regulator [Ruegeria sp. Ofav3-42]
MTHNDSTQKDDFCPQDFLPYLLNRAAEESSLEFQQAYRDRYGMLRTEWRVLFHLGNYGEMTAKEIGERARIHKTKISRAVSKLEQRRYLTRTRSPSDRRVEYLTLTPLGQTVYLDLRETAKQYDAKLAGMFPHEETALLRKMLRRLAHMT